MSDINWLIGSLEEPLNLSSQADPKLFPPLSLKKDQIERLAQWLIPSVIEDLMNVLWNVLFSYIIEYNISFA